MENGASSTSQSLRKVIKSVFAEITLNPFDQNLENLYKALTLEDRGNLTGALVLYRLINHSIAKMRIQLLSISSPSVLMPLTSFPAYSDAPMTFPKHTGANNPIIVEQDQQEMNNSTALEQNSLLVLEKIAEYSKEENHNPSTEGIRLRTDFSRKQIEKLLKDLLLKSFIIQYKSNQSYRAKVTTEGFAELQRSANAKKPLPPTQSAAEETPLGPKPLIFSTPLAVATQEKIPTPQEKSEAKGTCARISIANLIN